MGQLEQITLVEQIHLQRAAVEELVNRLWAKGRDPVDPLEVTQDVDLFLGDHAAVADQDETLQTELLSDFGELRQ